MKIRLLKNYQMSGPGDIIDPAKPVADLLIGRNIAVAVKVPETKKKKRAR